MLPITATAYNHAEKAENLGNKIQTRLNDLGGKIDFATFEQILELGDDPNEREFTKSLVFGYFKQAEQCFVDMDSTLKKGGLAALSSLGLFLKGSSAVLGLTKVKDICADIERYGQVRKGFGAEGQSDASECLTDICESLEELRREFAVARVLILNFLGEDSRSIIQTLNENLRNAS